MKKRTSDELGRIVWATSNALYVKIGVHDPTPFERAFPHARRISRAIGRKLYDLGRADEKRKAGR
jgi:hypothetical protein